MCGAFLNVTRTWADLRWRDKEVDKGKLCSLGGSLDMVLNMGGTWADRKGRDKG